MTAGANWLKKLKAERELSLDELELAKLAAEQLDVAEKAGKDIKKHGSLVKGKFGPKANPAIDVARKASESFAKLAKALRLAGEPKYPVGRPSMMDKTWNQSQAETKKSDKPDEWAEFSLPKSSRLE